MTDLTMRSLTHDEALEAIRRTMHEWRTGRLGPAEALASVGDALDASSPRLGAGRRSGAEAARSSRT